MIQSWWYAAPWLTLIAIWIIGAVTTKSTARTEPSSRRVFHMLAVIVAAAMMFGSRVPSPLRTRVIPNTLAIFRIGVALTWLGIAFAIWARFILGRNWSGMVEVKQDHKLVIAGPYRIVRHPIYTGILLALAGTALGTGTLRCFVALPIFFVAWLTKSRHEEEFMRQQFGEEYRRYQERVKGLIPGVI